MALNFSQPLQVYKWLKYLDNHPKYGYLIRPNLNLSKRNLGFSLKSNDNGLRGEIPEKIDNVIIGTSYAMGFGVDNGFNWYERCKSLKNVINLGLPVGFNEWVNLKKDFAPEANKLAIVIYHCNFLAHEEIYAKWRNTKLSVADAFSWQKHFFNAAKLQFSKKFKDKQKERFRKINWNKVKLNINIEYALSSESKKEETFLKLEPLLSQFENVYVIRVLCKEEMIGRLGLSSDLIELNQQHEDSWQLFIKTMKHLKNIAFHECEFDNPVYYLSHDSHLTREGNLFLAKYIDNIMTTKLQQIQ